MARQTLPTTLRPTHYALTLKPDLDAWNFDGRVMINLTVLEETNVIVLNTVDIETKSVEVTVLETGDSFPATVSTNPKLEQTSYTLPGGKALKIGQNVTLDVRFKGILNDKMQGFYRSSYKDESGATKYLATTQFEATYARWAFPCWDEPALKATFDVTLIVPEHLTALSNLHAIREEPIVNTEDATKLKQVTFATTPIMSTYLLAFIVAPFQFIEGYTSPRTITDKANNTQQAEKIRVRIYAMPHEVEHGRFALGVAIKALELFEKVFSIPYPLPKADLVAIPDFATGAMENWGLITYRTVALLFDEKTSSASLKKRVAYVVCHELAHQWFGNLVTMEWWDDLWLNEGFATWVGDFAVDKIFPDMDVWTSFITESVARAQALDCLRSSHPIEVQVNDAADIAEIFDAISYQKGSSVIRMLNARLGSDVFLSGIRRYLARHQYSNAKTADLWKALSEESGTDVVAFMENWTRKVGFPVLDVSPVSGGSVKITQRRYLSSGDVKAAEDEVIWQVPLAIRSVSSAQVSNATLETKSQEIAVDAEVFKLNAGQGAFYRVNYFIEMLSKLGLEVSKGSAGILGDPKDRIGLISDTFALAVSGDQRTSGFLELVNHFAQEENYFVLQEINNHLGELTSAWYEQSEAVLNGLKALRRKLFSPMAQKLGWQVGPNDSHLTTLLRALVLSVLTRSGDDKTIQEATNLFWRMVKDKDMDAVHPSLRGTVFSAVLRNPQGDGVAEFEAVLAIYHDTSMPADQKMIALQSMGNVSNTSVLDRLLQMSVDDEQVRRQDVNNVYSSTGANAAVRNYFLDWFYKNYDLIESRYDPTSPYMGNFVKFVLKGITNPQKIAQAREFFAQKNTAPYQRAADQALEGADIASAWVQRDAKDVEQWLRREGYMA